MPGILSRRQKTKAIPEPTRRAQIYVALNHELHYDMEGPCGPHQGGTRIESVYSVIRSISGTPLDDSFHLGQTIVNDYGRPYENGFNNYSGVSGYATAGRFAIYLRAEFQGAPSATGYSAALAQTADRISTVPLYFIPSSTYPYGNTTAVYNQTTIPQGPISTATQGRFLEAYISYQILDHVISFGKQDQWLGPAQGASMAFSNNAQNFYALEINRIEPLHVPGLSMLTGPFRYEFLVGALRGHTEMADPLYELNPSSGANNVTNPGDSWVHVEKVSLRPYKDLEFGFERTAMFGGEGHQPVNLKSFLRSFFSISAGNSTRREIRPIPARVLAPSTFPGGCLSCATGLRSTATRRCTTISLRSMLRAAPPCAREFISPMFPAFPGSTCA